MKKTFAQLTVGDNLYRCVEGSLTIDTYEIIRVDRTQITYSYGDTTERSDKTVIKTAPYQRNNFYLFVNKPDAIRYAKAQTVKKLFTLIENARQDIEAIRKFRNEKFELLNHEWTDANILELEKQLNA